MGTSMKRVEVVWGSWSEWLIVNSADCFTCSLGGYDTQTSQSSNFFPTHMGSAFMAPPIQQETRCLTQFASQH